MPPASRSKLNTASDGQVLASAFHIGGDDSLRCTSRRTRFIALAQILILVMVMTYFFYLQPRASSEQTESYCAVQLGNNVETPQVAKNEKIAEESKQYFFTRHNDSFTFTSPSISEARYAVCISGTRFTAFTSPRILESFDKYVLGVNKTLAQEYTATSVDLFIHAFYEGSPDAIIQMLYRYRPYLRGFIIRRYDKDYRDEIETDAVKMMGMEIATIPVSLWRGVHWCHSLLRHQELIRMRRYDAVLRARPDILYNNPVEFGLYTQPNTALYFPPPSNCCGPDKSVRIQQDDGICIWSFGAIGYNDQAAIGASYAMELYSNMLPTYVSVKHVFGGMSEQLLHYYIVADLKVPTFKANFTYTLEREG